jgi:replicative DNA helicase
VEVSNVEPIRKPPHSTEAERAVLGCMIQDAKAVEVVMGLCGCGDFYHESHRLVFSAIAELYSSGKPVDVTALTISLSAVGNSINNPGTFLSDLVMDSPAPAAVEHFAQIVAECSARRAMIVGASSVVADLYRDETLDSAAAKLSELSLRPTNKELNDTPAKYMTKYMGRLKETWAGDREKFIPTGYKDFDEQSGGFEVGGVTIVGGDSKAGKTTFLLHAAQSMARRNYGVGFFEFDMQAQDIPLRWICSRSGYSWNRLHSHDKTQVDPDYICKLAKDWEDLPFYLSGQDEVGTDFDAVLLLARRWKRLYGIRALFVDSIQSLRFSSVRGLEGEALVAAQMDAMVRLAVTLDLAVVAISEYSNDQEKSPKTRFKGSGRIHYAASLGLAIERPVDPETGEKSDWLKVFSVMERNQPFCRFVLRGGFNCFNLFTPDHESVPLWVFGKKGR